MKKSERQKKTRPTARVLLVWWANTEQNWVRALVQEVLKTRRSLPDEVLESVYEMFLAESELSAEPPTQVSKLAFEQNGEVEFDPLTVTEIYDVENVNRLAPKQSISFNPRMTVLFGENATGKSGYVRILKQIAAVRSAEPILPNVHTSRKKPPPQALIKYRLGQVDQEIKWNGQSGVQPFTRMSVFDSRALTFHLEDDLTYVYTPGDLALFQHVHQAIHSIRDKLESDGNQRDPARNPFLTQFQRDTEVYPKIVALGSSTDLSSLSDLATVSENEIAGLDQLRDKVRALEPDAVSARLKVKQFERELFEMIEGVTSALCSFDWGEFNRGVEKVVEAEDQLSSAREAMFTGDSVPGVLSDAWKEFILASEQYLKEIDRDDYPGSGDRCIYCGQVLAEAAMHEQRHSFLPADDN